MTLTQRHTPVQAGDFTWTMRRHHLVANTQIAGIVLEGKSLMRVRLPGSGPGQGQGQRREQDWTHTSFMSASKGNIWAKPLGGPERYRQTGKVKFQKRSQEKSLVGLGVVLKKQVDLNRERPLQMGVGASV